MAAKKKPKAEKKQPKLESQKAKADKAIADVRKAEQQAREEAVKTADAKEPFGKGSVLMRVLLPFGTDAIWCDKGDIIKVSPSKAEELDLDRLASKLTGG